MLFLTLGSAAAVMSLLVVATVDHVDALDVLAFLSSWCLLLVVFTIVAWALYRRYAHQRDKVCSIVLCLPPCR